MDGIQSVLGKAIDVAGSISNSESGRDGSASRWMVVVCTAYAAEKMETAVPHSNGFTNDLDCFEVRVIHERDHDELKIASGRRNWYIVKVERWEAQPSHVGV